MTAEQFRPSIPHSKGKPEGGFSERVKTVEGTKPQSRSRVVTGPVCPSGPVPSGIQPIPDGHTYDLGLTRRPRKASQEKMLSKRQRAKNKGK